MVEMIVESVRVSVSGFQRVVVLKEKESERYLLIWVGTPEAGAIALALQGVPVQRPLTHDLLKSVIETMGGRVRSIMVTDLLDNTFYARVVVDLDGRAVEIDSRPSDAIALALRSRAPIFVAEKVLLEAGIVPEAEAKTKEEEDKLSVFRDFINSLGREDAGTGQDEQTSESLS